jgi:hypothetical protein
VIKPLRFFLSLTLFLPLMAFGQLESKDRPRIPAIKNIDQIVKDMTLERFKDKSFTRKIKVAILDDGFDGEKKEIGSRLPANTVYEKGDPSDADNIVPGFHGTRLAVLFADAMKKSGAKTDYELHLFYTFGLDKFESAIKAVAEGNYDIVIYAQVWQWGGNGDGKGFINALVDKATESGVIWLNATGNFGTTMRTAPVEAKDENGTSWVTFKDKTTDGVNLTCEAPAGKQCSLNLMLSWNDFKENSHDGTDKDLDLFLYDKDGKQIASAELNQVLVKETDKQSVFPRETILQKVAPGKYKARVKVKSANFKADKDVLKLMLAVNPGVSMENPSQDETILPPADNPKVIVIGAADAIETSHSVKLGVPSIYLNSAVDFNGAVEVGSSMATAMAAVDATLELGTGTEKTKDAIEKALQSITKPAPTAKVAAAVSAPAKKTAFPMPQAPKAQASWPGSVAANGKTVVIKIAPDSSDEPAPIYHPPPPRPEDFDEPLPPVIRDEPNSCMHPFHLEPTNDTVAGILSDGGVAVIYQGHPAIVVGFDIVPYKKNPAQVVFALPSGIKGANPDQIPHLRNDAIPLINTPRPICNW